MEASAYAIESQVEAGHWWFVGRRKLLADMIVRHRVPEDARVLDIGTGTGTNLRLLQSLGFANRRAIDTSEEAIRWCAEKGLGEVEKGDVTDLPYADGEFGLVLATDVIEHVDDHRRAMAEISRVLAPEGIAIVTVPAFQSLWGLQDEVARHKRRYRLKSLRRLVQDSGLACAESFYFNYILLVPIWIARQILRLARVKLHSENELNTPWLNRVLTLIFMMDVATARVVHPPAGVSIVAVARARGPSRRVSGA
jgi:SAM-dependent methyltransferase